MRFANKNRATVNIFLYLNKGSFDGAPCFYR